MKSRISASVRREVVEDPSSPSKEPSASPAVVNGRDSSNNKASMKYFWLPPGSMVAGRSESEDSEVTFSPTAMKKISTRLHRNVAGNGLGSHHAIGANDDSAVLAVASSTSAGTDLRMISNKENYHLKELVMSQVGIIQRQSEDLRRKEAQIKELKSENDDFRSRLLKLEIKGTSSSSSTNQRSLLISNQPSSSSTPSKRTVSTQTTFKEQKSSSNARSNNKDKSVLTELSDVRKKLTHLNEERTKARKKKREAAKAAEVDSISKGWLKVGDPYSTNSGDDFVTAAHKEMREILSKAEVPGWRERFLSPTYHTEGTEDLGESSFDNRHKKHELDEKRRKRWDMQHLREQRHLERLKARYNQPEHLSKYSTLDGLKTRDGPSKNKSKLAGKGKWRKGNVKDVNPSDQVEGGLTPDPLLVKGISVEETVPVLSWGLPVPSIGETKSSFKLPFEYSETTTSSTSSSPVKDSSSNLKRKSLSSTNTDSGVESAASASAGGHSAKKRKRMTK